MSKLTTPFSLFAALLPVALALGTSTAHAQSAPPRGPQDPYDADGDDADEPDETAPDNAPVESAPVQPRTAQPRMQPPAPPGTPPAPPQVQVQAQVAQPASAGGQWVYTQQYGWIWMAYGDQYVYNNSSSPYEYVYYPSYGWTWLTAPWLWGWGPSVYFSVGPRFFPWFHHPFVRGGFGGRPFVGGRAVVGRGFRGAVRAPVRGSFGGSHFSGSHFSGGHFSGGAHFSGHVGGHGRR